MVLKKLPDLWEDLGAFFKDLFYREKDQYAFGVEKTYWKYRLRYARYRELARILSEFIRNSEHPPVDLLDVGVGRGRTSMYLEEYGENPRVRYHGIDVKDRRLNSVDRKEDWHLVKGDAEQGLPFADEGFDAVICEQVLEHLRDPSSVIGDIARVTRPGGLVVIGVPVFPPLLFELRRDIIPEVDRWFGIERSHVQVFNRRKIQRMMESRGLEVQNARGFRFISGGPLGFLENHRWWWQLQRKLGDRFPGATGEVQVYARKKDHR